MVKRRGERRVIRREWGGARIGEVKQPWKVTDGRWARDSHGEGFGRRPIGSPTRRSDDVIGRCHRRVALLQLMLNDDARRIIASAPTIAPIVLWETHARPLLRHINTRNILHLRWCLHTNTSFFLCRVCVCESICFNPLSVPAMCFVAMCIAFFVTALPRHSTAANRWRALTFEWVKWAWILIPFGVRCISFAWYRWINLIIIIFFYFRAHIKGERFVFNVEKL